jgi:transcriptional regulator with XRE-family HTH domain
MEVINRYLIIGRAIRQARLEKGLDRETLAKSIGKTATCLRFWETGERKISIEVLEKFTKVLDKSFDYFLNFTEENELNKSKDNLEANFLELLDQTIKEMEDNYFYITIYTDKKGNKSITNISRLWSRLIRNGAYFPKDAHYDKQKGGVENEKQLTQLLLKRLNKEEK